MPEKITHEGIVTQVGESQVTVRIQSTSACGSCHAKGLCNMSEKTDKDVVVKTKEASSYSVGEEVDVFLMSNTGLKAVLYAYVLSLAAGAAAFVAASFLTPRQGLWGLAALAAIALYFWILKKTAPKINRQFQFGISKKGPETQEKEEFEQAAGNSR